MVTFSLLRISRESFPSKSTPFSFCRQRPLLFRSSNLLLVSLVALALLPPPQLASARRYTSVADFWRHHHRRNSTDGSDGGGSGSSGSGSSNNSTSSSGSPVPPSAPSSKDSAYGSAHTAPTSSSSAPFKGPNTFGVNWGRGLSSEELDATAGVALIKKMGFKAVKLFQPDPKALTALQGSGLQIVLGTPNSLVPDLASARHGVANAKQWLAANVVPYAGKGAQFSAIAVGNELLNAPTVGTAFTQVVPAMWNMHAALQQLGLPKVAVVTPQHTGFLANSYPPSHTTILPALRQYQLQLLDFLNKTGSPLYINCYPFFPFMDGHIGPDFAFFKGLAGFFDAGLYYQNLFDAMIDGVAWAAEKAGFGNVPIVVSETGWSTGGATIATRRNAERWNAALVGHLNSGRGTPKRPSQPLPTFLFEMFDEDQKDTAPGDFELHWGLAYANGTAKYPLDVTAIPPPGRARIPPPTWCVLSPSARSKAVSKAMDWACSPKGGGLDCKRVTARCPSALHATAIFNFWFQAQGQVASACNFSGTAVTTTRLPAAAALSAAAGCSLPGRPSADTMAATAASSLAASAPAGPSSSPTAVPQAAVGGGNCSSQAQANLQSALDWACANGADCGPIQPGGACFLPNTVLAHASFALSSYYSRMSGRGASCAFGGVGQLVQQQPAGLNCTLPAVNGQLCVAVC